MTRLRTHAESHRSGNTGWLRAAVLGANDGLLSTASLVLGVASAAASHHAVLIAATAGLVAGAMSMAAGEYVSVSSQSDSEQADLQREGRELYENPVAERDELKNIYVSRGLDLATATMVADQLTAKDALSAHARDELGFSKSTKAQPVQAAIASAAAFTAGATAPLLVVAVTPHAILVPTVWTTSLAALLVLGLFAAKAGGANAWRATVRVVFWGALAMGVTAGIGHLVGHAV
jgi:VIT1/CCC1 family predicted Fe2+/Mn2+ transporter